MGWQDVSEEEILNANIDKYNDENILRFYKDFKEPKYAYIEYEVVFNAVLQTLIADRGTAIRAVDMCGGAGNVEKVPGT
jgi:hypothetical protein